MKPALTERLVEIGKAARAAGHGSRGKIYDAACVELGVSRQTLLKKLAAVTVTGTRKRRADAGRSALSREEAQIISATLTESTRKNGKRLYSVADAVDALRADNRIRAEYIDENTGETRPLSESAIIRALNMYKLHPDQLSAPAPAIELASLHPNHVWQIDASLCVLYYLKNGAHGKTPTGLQVMDSRQFYKNKPKNLARITSDRVWSYEITDHASGWIYVEYVMGAESGENLCNVLINALQERGGADVLHGVPRVLYLDPGSANTAAMTKNLCHSLGIRMLVHKAHNARATGSVEKARDLIERKFEPGLAFRPVHSLDELNALAALWRASFNARAVHSRHGHTRTAVWLTITQEQLIKAPAPDICRELAVAAPERRRVTPHLRVKFAGSEFDVSGVPGLIVGQWVLVTRNPWRDDAAQLVLTDADGHEYFHVVDRVERNEFGFATSAAIIGQQWQRPVVTQAQTAAQELEQIITGTETPEAAAAARKSKQLPFNGEFNPYRDIEEATLPAFLPKRGQASTVRSPRVEQRPLTHVEAAQRLLAIFRARGTTWSPAHYQALAAQWPDGVQEEQLDSVADTLLASAANVVNLR